jgi:hypothetical protein
MPVLPRPVDCDKPLDCNKPVGCSAIAYGLRRGRNPLPEGERVGRGGTPYPEKALHLTVAEFTPDLIRG